MHEDDRIRALREKQEKKQAEIQVLRDKERRLAEYTAFVTSPDYTRVVREEKTAREELHFMRCRMSKKQYACERREQQVKELRQAISQLKGEVTRKAQALRKIVAKKEDLEKKARRVL